MGSGIIAGIATILPFSIYLTGMVLAFMAFLGKPRWATLFIVWVLPLRNVVDRMHEFPMGKDFLDILILSAILGWIISAMSERRPIFEKSPLNAISAIVIGYTYISLWRGYFYLSYFTPFDFFDPRLQEWKNYITLPILHFLTINTVRDRKWIWRFVAVISVSFFLVNFYTIRQISLFSSIESRVKINGTLMFLGPNELAAFINQYAVLFLSLFFAIRFNLRKLWLGLIIAMSFYCVAFLFSRGAYLGLVAGLFFIFALRKRILLIPLLLLVVCWQAALPQKVKDRILMTTNEYGELDLSNQKRIEVWEQSLNLFKHDPIMGVGFAVFISLGFILGDTHNIYLKMLAEQGMVGFLIFFFLIILFIKQGWSLYQKAEDPLFKALGVGFVGCIVTLMVNNVFGNRWSYLEMSSNLWVFAGLVSRALIVIQEEKKNPSPPQKKTSKRIPQKIKKRVQGPPPEFSILKRKTGTLRRWGHRESD